VPVNPKGGAIFGYDSVTSSAAIDPPVELAATTRLPMLHCMMSPLSAKAEWLATMEAVGNSMFNEAEEMAAAAGLVAALPGLRNSTACARLPPASFRDWRHADT